MGTGSEPPAGDLAARQAQLVAALTCGAPVPAGFDGTLLAAARNALVLKRAGEVARQWPSLAAALGAAWRPRFATWAADRPTRGAWRDGWDLARELAADGLLPAPAREELARREATWHYDGRRAPRRRRGFAVCRVGGTVAAQVAGRVRVLRRDTD